MKRTKIKIDKPNNILKFKKPNIEGKKILSLIKFILIIAMLVLIYIKS